MASVMLKNDTLLVRLALLEKIGAFHGDLRVPLSTIREVYVSDTFAPVRGVRMPGTGLPGVIALGTRRYRGERDFTALYVCWRAVVMELEGWEYKRVSVSDPNPERVKELIKQAIAPQKWKPLE